MKELIACCGLDCEKCDARKATVNNDNELRTATAKLWSSLNGVEITPDMINCMGCRTGGVKTPFCSDMCEIRKCAAERNMETCGSCPDIEICQTVAMVIGSNKEARANLMD